MKHTNRRIIFRPALQIDANGNLVDITQRALVLRAVDPIVPPRIMSQLVYCRNILGLTPGCYAARHNEQFKSRNAAGEL